MKDLIPIAKWNLAGKYKELESMLTTKQSRPSYTLWAADFSKIPSLEDHLAWGLWYLNFSEVIVAVYSGLQVLTNSLYQYTTFCQVVISKMVIW